MEIPNIDNSKSKETFNGMINNANVKCTLINNVNKTMHPLLLPNLYTTSYLQSNKLNLEFGKKSISDISLTSMHSTSLNSINSLHTNKNSLALSSSTSVNSLDTSNVNNYNANNDNQSVTNVNNVANNISFLNSNDSKAPTDPDLPFKDNTAISSINMADNSTNRKILGKDIKQFMKNNKRQRIGPSCDSCRAKKVRCDAQIEILIKDKSIINELSPKLNYILEKEDIDKISETILKDVKLPPELNSTNSKLRLMKHLNKIVLFSPCSSCIKINRKKKFKMAKRGRKTNKKKNNINDKPDIDDVNEIADEYFCTFSKGLSKSDICIFQKLNNLTNKNINELTVDDYLVAGYK